MSNINYKNFINCTEPELHMILQWRNNPIVSSNSLSKHIISYNEHINFIESLKKSKIKNYFIVSSKNEYLGVISINDIYNHTATLGYYKNPSIITKGIGLTLLKTAINLAKNTYKLKVLKMESFVSNIASIKSIERSGFRFLSNNRDIITYILEL